MNKVAKLAAVAAIAAPSFAFAQDTTAPVQQDAFVESNELIGVLGAGLGAAGIAALVVTALAVTVAVSDGS